MLQGTGVKSSLTLPQQSDGAQWGRGAAADIRGDNELTPCILGIPQNLKKKKNNKWKSPLYFANGHYEEKCVNRGWVWRRSLTLKEKGALWGSILPCNPLRVPWQGSGGGWGLQGGSGPTRGAPSPLHGQSWFKGQILYLTSLARVLAAHNRQTTLFSVPLCTHAQPIFHFGAGRELPFSLPFFPSASGPCETFFFIIIIFC